MWSNIGNVEEHKESLEFTDDKIHQIYRNKAGLEQNLGCASSFKGIYTGKCKNLGCQYYKESCLIKKSSRRENITGV